MQKKGIARLWEISQRSSRKIIGLMSGTSMDGLDIALCELSGNGSATQVKLLAFETAEYPESVKTEIRKVFAKSQIDFQHLVLLNPWLGSWHGELILNALKKWEVSPDEVDAIASHGQTVFHAPRHQHGLEDWPNATLQIGDADHLAIKTGIITLSDFRQKHIAAGGEGAPLAVYGDYFIFSQPGENRILLNMGGIANFTFLPASNDAATVFVSDTGPGNTLLDAFTRELFGLAFDADGALAKQGTVSEALVSALKVNPFFTAPFPKTTGPEVFNLGYVQAAQARSGTEGLSGHDILASLVAFSAETIAEAVRAVLQPNEKYTIYMSGGGMHNPLLVASLKKLLPEIPFQKTDELGILGDAKEAVLFAILANETLTDSYTDFGNRPGVPSVTMGKISLPN